jgi:hypothetical protein
MLGKVAYILLPIHILYLMEFFKSLSEIPKHSITQISSQIQMFCLCFYIIWTSVACAVGPSVNSSSTDFSFQNLVCWNFFEFSVAEVT